MPLLGDAAPFAFGLVVQIGAVVGGFLAAPPDDNRQNTKVARADFAMRLDKAVALPSLLALTGPVLLETGPFSGALIAFAGGLFAIGSVAAIIWFRGVTVTRYERWSSKLYGITPFNAALLIANALVILLVSIFGLGVHESQDEPKANPPASVDPSGVTR